MLFVVLFTVVQSCVQQGQVSGEAEYVESKAGVSCVTKVTLFKPG